MIIVYLLPLSALIDAYRKSFYWNDAARDID